MRHFCISFHIFIIKVGFTTRLWTFLPFIHQTAWITTLKDYGLQVSCVLSKRDRLSLLCLLVFVLDDAAACCKYLRFQKLLFFLFVFFVFWVFVVFGFFLVFFTACLEPYISGGFNLQKCCNCLQGHRNVFAQLSKLTVIHIMHITANHFIISSVVF